MSVNKRKEISILQWNCRSILPKLANLQLLLNQHEIDVFCLSETWLIDSDVFVLPDYVIFKLCQATRRRGLALGVHRSLANKICLEKVPSFNEIEIIACSIDLGFDTIRIANVYIPPSSEYTLTRSECHRLLTCMDHSFVMTGDLNAHHQVWGCADIDTRGRLIMETVDELGLTLSNDGTITRIARPPCRPSAIDLTFCSPSLSLSLSWRVLDDRCGSDHYPTVSTIRYEASAIRRLSRRRQFDLTKNIDWTRFMGEVTSTLSGLTGLPFEERCEAFRDSLIAAAESSQTKSLPAEDGAWSYSRVTPWWDEEVGAAHRETRAADKAFRRLGTPESFDLFIAAQQSFQRLRHRKKKASWQAYCESFNERTSISELFNAARRYRNRIAASDPTMDGNTLHQFACKLAPDFVQNQPSHDQAVDNQSSDFDADFTLNELEAVLANVSDSAPGEDRISYSMITHLAQEDKQFLLDCYNEAYRESKIPAWWKVAKVIGIKKPGKDPSKAESWRPICLLSVLRKIFEKLQLLRLEHWVESAGLLSEGQFGFRKGRSTMDFLTLLLNYISSAFERKEVVVAVFLDVKGAFDNVNIEILCNKLQQLGAPQRLVNTTWTMMNERVLHFENEAGEKVTRSGYVGLPQGAPNSPLMYAVYTQDLHQVTGDEVDMIEFADDSTLIIRHKDERRAVDYMQVAVDNVVSRYRSLGLEVSESKTVAQIFSRRHTTVQPELTIRAGTGENRVSIWNQDVAVTYLGRRLDRKLLMNADILYTQQRCEKRLNFMRSVAGTWWGAHPSSMLTLFLSTVRPILEYGTVARLRLKKAQMLKLERIQWKALRIAGGFIMSTPCCAMEILMGVPPLGLRFEQIYHQYVLKATCLQRTRVLTSFQELARLRPDHPQVREYMRTQALGIPMVPPRFPFTYEYDSLMFMPSTDETMFDRYHEISPESRPFLARTLFRSLLPPEEEFVSFFTDGSRTENGTGLGIYGPGGHRTIHHLSNPASVFTSEIRAILEALRQMVHNDENMTTVRIFTDSWSCIQALKYPKSSVHTHPAIIECRHQLHKLELMGTAVTLSWVPSHVGIAGNEFADRLAAEGAELEEPTLSRMINHREFTPLVRIWLNQQWQEMWQAEERGRHAFSIFPHVTTKPWFRHLQMSRRHIVFINRAATNHNRTDAHLARFGIVEANQCSCGDDYASVDHLIWRCRSYNHATLEQALEPQTINTSIRDLIGLRRWEDLRKIADHCRAEGIPL